MVHPSQGIDITLSYVICGLGLLYGLSAPPPVLCGDVMTGGGGGEESGARWLSRP